MRPDAPSTPFKAGAAYFAIVFAAGFALGTIRALLIGPAIGETAAVAVELPLMLAISWLACGWVLARIVVAGTLGARLAMGGWAFGMLMAAEVGVSTLFMDRSLAQHIAHYGTAPALLGLAGQIAFASFPLFSR